MTLIARIVLACRQAGISEEELAKFLSVRKLRSDIGNPHVYSRKTERNAKIVAAYRAGMTLESVGHELGLTRERVRQILRAEGVAAYEGGQTITTLMAIPALAEYKLQVSTKRDEKTFRRFGCSYGEYLAIRDMDNGINRQRPTIAFSSQRTNAKARGIAWGLSLAEWWAIWQASGRWANRGRGKGNYCMARIGDTGAYEKSNVEIILATDNSKDSFLVHSGEKRVQRRREAEAWSLWKEGKRIPAIAETMKLQRNTVAQYINMAKHKSGEL